MDEKKQTDLRFLQHAFPPQGGVDLTRHLWVHGSQFLYPIQLRPMLSFFNAIREWWQARRTRQITPEQVQTRVERGAAYLDEVDPTWYRRIDAKTLELHNGRHCVLGQLHGEFRLGLGRSNLISLSSAPRASLSPTAYGFKCVEGVSDAWQRRDYALLDEAWMEAVRRRQMEDPTMEVSAEVSGDSLPKKPAEVTPAAPQT